MNTKKLINIDTLARTIYGEARGEGMDGMRAVAHVVLNRLALSKKNASKRKQFGSTISLICMKPWQFSCWNFNDVNREKLLSITDADPVFLKCLIAADEAIGCDVLDKTFGSTHYHSVAVEFPKSWGEVKKPAVKIGNHLFYNNID